MTDKGYGDGLDNLSAERDELEALRLVAQAARELLANWESNLTPYVQALAAALEVRNDEG